MVVALLFLFPFYKVQAESYYSPYGAYQIVKEVPKVAQELVEIKEENTYLWYQLKREGQYFRISEEHFEYPLQTDFWKYGEWSEWTNFVPKIQEGEIESRKVYHYQKMKPITIIRFSDIAPSSLEFQNIHIYKNSKEIAFTKRIDSNLWIELSEPCYIDELEIVFTLLDVTEEEKHFQIEWLYGLENPVALSNYSRFWFQGAYETSYQYRNMNLQNELWESEQISFDYLESNLHQRVYTVNQYRYREKLYYYEKEWKEYCQGYHEKAPAGCPYYDSSTEKKILKARFREKIELEDFILVHEKIDFSSFIKTTVPYNLSSNINWKKSGIYQIFLDTAFGKIKKDVYLDLKEQEQTLKKELNEANATIVSLKNETSNQKEATAHQDPSTFKVKKQSVSVSILFICFFLILGIGIGRIMTMKKKF